MALRVRPTRNPAEFDAAIGAIGHYFGGARRGRGRASGSAGCCPASACTPPSTATRSSAVPASFPFELSVPGGQLPCAGVTVVGVLPTHRRRGILDRLMRAQLADVRERGEPVAALWASEETIYGRFGYGLAVPGRDDPGPACPRGAAARAAGPHGHDRGSSVTTRRSTVFPRIYDRVRRRTPGFVSRTHGLVGAPQARRPSRAPARWRRAEPAAARDRRPCPPGYALYRIKLEFEEATNKSQVQVLEAIGDSPAATRELWRYLLAIDWVDEIHCELLPADHPLFLLVQRPNRLNWKVFDGLWLRLVDVGAALVGPRASRATVASPSTSRPIRSCRTTSAPGRSRAGSARRSRRRADVRLDVQALASAYLGGFTFAELARAGRVEEVARGGSRASRRALPRRRQALVPGDLLSFRG